LEAPPEGAPTPGRLSSSVNTGDDSLASFAAGAAALAGAGAALAAGAAGAALAGAAAGSAASAPPEMSSTTST
jgi:hypothetical protein